MVGLSQSGLQTVVSLYFESLQCIDFGSSKWMDFISFFLAGLVPVTNTYLNTIDGLGREKSSLGPRTYFLLGVDENT